jgi:Tol biopolymer transport system component
MHPWSVRLDHRSRRACLVLFLCWGATVLQPPVLAAEDWESDRRLTRSTAGSETSINFARSVAADDRGRVHVAWVEQQDGNPEITYKRSIDGGVSWGPPIRLTADAAASNNPSIAVEGDVVHVVWWDTRSGAHQIYHKRSLDGGATWEADRQVTSPPGGGAHCSVAVAGSRVHLVYVGDRDGNEEVYYVASVDRGATWNAPQRLSALPWNSYTPTVAAAGDAVYVAWTDTRDQMQMGTLEEEYFRRSLDGGVTWEAETRLTFDQASSWAPSLAADGSDVWIVWFDERGGEWGVYTKRSTDRGATWTPDRRLTRAAGAAMRPCIARYGDHLHVVFWDSRDGNEEIYWLTSGDRGESWSEPIRLTRDGASSVKPSVAASAAGVHVVWTDGRDGSTEIYTKRLPGKPVSVGNGRIAFSRQVSGRSQIFTVNGEGGDERQLTFEGTNEYPAWSRDGSRLVFDSDRTGPFELWVMNADGSGQTALTSGTPGNNFVPDWSYDGTRVAYASAGDGSGAPQIWVIDAHGKAAARLTTMAFAVHPTWEPGDERIYFGGNAGAGPQIWGMFADGRGQEQKTGGLGPGYPDANVPELSRTGRLVFWAGVETRFGEVWSVEIGDPAGPRRLTETPDPRNSDNPAWSPDGQWILFDTDQGGQGEIWIMSSDGAGARPLISAAGQVSWQPVPLATAASGASFLPVALSAFPGAGGSVFSTEATLTNRAEAAALDVAVTLTSLDGSAASATLTLPRGASRTYGDLLREAIPGLPPGRQAGTVSFAATEAGTSTRSDALSVVARTTTPVSEPPGRAGLAYLGVPASSALTGTAWIAGLRQNASDRSNLALLNAGTSGDVTLRVTLHPAPGGSPAVLPDVTLAPGRLQQLDGVLTAYGLALSEGWAEVTRVAGTGTFYAYGVVNDERSSDGSFIAPVRCFGTTGLTVPVAVELPTFETELVVANSSAQAKSLRLTYAPGEARYATIISLRAGEQRIIPSFVAFLRQSLPPGIVPAAGPTFAGPVFVTPEGTGDVSGVVASARTVTPSSALGRFGVLTPAVPYGHAFTGPTRVDGLAQDAETRSNVALVNTGEADASASTFRLEILDDSGAGVAERTATVAAGSFVQLDRILAGTGAQRGSVRITRTSGTNPYIAYGVLNDGAEAGLRTGDGAYVEATPE